MNKRVKVFRTDGRFLEEVLNTIGYRNVLEIVSEHRLDGAIINVIYKDTQNTRKKAEELKK